MGKTSRFLLAIATICVFFGVSYSQSKLGEDLVFVGKMDDKLWFLDPSLVTDTVRKTKIAPMLTNHEGGIIVSLNEIDCTDSTIRLHGLQFFEDGKKVVENMKKSDWLKADGIAIKLVELVCKPKPKVRRPSHRRRA